MNFISKLKGAIYGQAIGDAMGAPVEGWYSAKILERFSGYDFGNFLPATHGGDPSLGKGDGRFTDDTLMMEALIFAYQDSQDHLDAYGYAKYLLPYVKGKPIWVPERGEVMDLYDRLFYPEKYPWLRMVPANAEPRSAGVGNMVNCGVAMWMLPVGAVNAGDPFAAYQEAADLGIAHNESFAVEAAAVMAAAFAEAFSTRGTIESGLEISRKLSKDGTHLAIEAVLKETDPADELETFLTRVRQAIIPFDQRAGHGSADGPFKLQSFNNNGRPSRLASIEELPIALAVLKYGAGDFIKTMRAAVYYGQDCDSITGMALGMFGALYGMKSLPQNLCSDVDAANRRDFKSLAESFLETILNIFEKDQRRFYTHEETLTKQ